MEHRRMRKRLLAFLLTAAVMANALPLQTFAEETQPKEVYLPEIDIGADILEHDVFYLATQTAAVPENGNGSYLLRVGRGGSAESESTALVKIADMTAKYGKDYVVRVRDEMTKVNNPEDNLSLMEMFEGNDFEQSVLGDEEELNELAKDDPEAQAAYKEGVDAAMEFLEEASGLKDKYEDENPYEEAVEELYGSDEENGDADEEAQQAEDASAEDDGASAEAADTEDGAEIDADIRVVPAEENGEVLTIDDGVNYDPVQAAANMFTGEDASAQRVEAEGNALQDLQAIANVMTNVVVGASVELTFAEGETEKYLEIIPKDNRTGDGDRMFYVLLGAPSGETTNSAASTCAVTIQDDEEQEPAELNFSQAGV